MRQEIRALQRRLGITTLYVTHDQEEAMAVSDRIVVMSKGCVMAQGTAQELYHRPRRSSSRIHRAREPRSREGARGARHARRASRRWAAMLAQAPARRSPATTVRLVLRPEAIEVVREGGHWTAMVAERVFLGEKIEYWLRCGETMLHVVRYNAGPAAVLEEGAAVRLRVADGAASVLPKEQA
jgi:ABC-type Fe3+/spermidine/putrescine transport system ATPase subunit